MKKQLLLALIFFFLVFTQTSFSQSGNVFGKIKDVNNEQIGGVKISLSNSHVFYSDFNGNFSAQNIPAGKYTITIESLGYLDQTTNDIEIKEDETTILELLLEENELKPSNSSTENSTASSSKQ